MVQSNPFFILIHIQLEVVFDISCEGLYFYGFMYQRRGVPGFNITPGMLGFLVMLGGN